MARATFFLSAGRCGTQTLRHAINVLRPDAVVGHESIGPEYAAFDKALAHMHEVEQILDGGQDYIETGWPCFVALPFYRAIHPEWNIVHIERRLQDQAASLNAQGLFDGRNGRFAPLLTGLTAEEHIMNITALAVSMRTEGITFTQLFGGYMAPARIAAMVGVDPGALTDQLRHKVDAYAPEAV